MLDFPRSGHIFEVKVYKFFASIHIKDFSTHSASL